ncbi:hypothetical protein JCM10212_001966 [Sporobolomyces blumeae]
MKVLRTLHYAVPVAIATFFGALTLEPVQRALIYLHWVHWPLPPFSHFSTPGYHGFAPAKVRNLRLETPDRAQIGAWLVMADRAYDEAIDADPTGFEQGQFNDDMFRNALRSPDYPTVIYLHGNAATRALPNRVRVLQKLSAMNCNVLAIDYRGFGDSTSDPPPTEQGVLIDARRAFDYLHLEHDVKPSQIVVMGQSLGTGIGTALAAQLEEEGMPIRALVLIAPFSSIATLLETYKLAKYIPLVSPLKAIPWLFTRLLGSLRTRLDSGSVISAISSRILLVHSADDPVIPYSHSESLANVLLEPFLAKAVADLTGPDRSKDTTFTVNEPGSSATENDKAIEKRRIARERLVHEERVGGWGTVRSFDRALKGQGRVVWAQAEQGQHTFIGETEYVMRLVRSIIFDADRTVR